MLSGSEFCPPVPTDNVFCCAVEVPICNSLRVPIARLAAAQAELKKNKV